MTEMGAPINARMGLNTWAAFVGTNENAAIAGDVAMVASEVTPVLKALRKNGTRRGRHPPPHGRFAADGLLPPLLGHRAGRKARDGVQGGAVGNCEDDLDSGATVKTVRALVLLAALEEARPACAQSERPPQLRAGALAEGVAHRRRARRAGVASAPRSPTGSRRSSRARAPTPAVRRRVRVLAGPKAIVIGIECDDPNPDGIVSFSKQRDAELFSEDHVRVVLGPFLDGRSGYVFAVNPAERATTR